MKKIGLVLLLYLSIFLIGCSNTPDNDKIPDDLNPTQSNILIAYFTWSDNTIVENPDEININASTSASVLAPGNATIVATFIQNHVGGTLFSMKVSTPYSSDYDECLDRAADEKAQNARPTLTTSVDNMDNYDIIFLGFPNWWYTVPMAIYSFLDSYDLSGKTIIPFCVHGTGGLASTIRDIQSHLSSDVNFITNAFHVYRPDTKGCEPDVISWLEEIGFTVN